MNPIMRIAVLATGAALLAGCGATGTGGGVAAGRGPGAAAAAPVAAASTCSPPAAASYPPLASVPARGDLPAGSLAAEIADRGYLVVGVSGDTRLLGARDFLDGGALKGFDIEVAKAVGRALLGPDPDIRFRVITAAQRFPLVNQGYQKDATDTGVDLVARAVSATCDRWAATDDTSGAVFSAGYLLSGQRLLVRSDLGIDRIQDLKSPHNRVCAPTGSTSLATLEKFDNVTKVEQQIHSDCLALWQEGKVDAITGDAAILAGFADQDPRAEVVGGVLDSTVYTLAVARSHPDFVRYVNAVLASPEFRATWSQAYDRYLKPQLGDDSQPRPDFSRPLP